MENDTGAGNIRLSGQYCTLGLRLKEIQKCLIQPPYLIFQELCLIVYKNFAISYIRQLL